MSTKYTQTIHSLTDVLRTAASEVTGQAVPGMITTTNNRTLAGAKSITLMDSRAALQTRTAQMRMSQVNNTTYTAPNFYTPFTQPQASQIPTNRKEIYTWAQWMYDNEPVLAAGIDFYSDFPLSGFKLECAAPYVKSFFEKLNKKIN